jgi:phospholipase C
VGRWTKALASAGLALGLIGWTTALAASTSGASSATAPSSGGPTETPIKHLVVIFQENVSFDHYFATYPNAANPFGEPPFVAAAGTPSVNGLSGALLTANNNEANPQRLDRSQAVTCDMNHAYTAEQQAADSGLMDKFVQSTGAASGGCDPKQVMDYYDGNTVTGLWNYAQHFALSDNSYGTTFGPSSLGAVNVTAGNTFGAICGPSSAVYKTVACTNASATNLPDASPGHPQAQGPGTMYGDADPYFDVCSYTEDARTAGQTMSMGGENVGDLLSAHQVTWGWFEGGFASPDYVPGRPSTDDPSKVCTGTTTNVAGAAQNDYIPHHEPFQYYASTANPKHLPPSSVADIGHSDQANHQYDLRDFWAAADSGNMPSVSYLKAPAAEDGHAGYSDPLDEQSFLANTINRLEKLPSWSSTAVLINWDDSDGWYDHQMGPVVSQSQSPLDALTGTSTCGTQAPSDGQQAKCGVGPRIPLLVISPYSKVDYVDNTFTTQSSVVRFIEDNWLASQRIGGGSADAWTGSLASMLDFSHHTAKPLYLDPASGEPVTR